MSITINGSKAPLPDDPRVSLLDLLREHLHHVASGCGRYKRGPDRTQKILVFRTFVRLAIA